MQQIEVNCPFCSAEQKITYIPGVQTLPCSCGRTFFARIDDNGRLYILKEVHDDYGTIPGSPYLAFVDQLSNALRNSKWQILGDRSNRIDLIARKKLGIYQPTCFLGLTNGNNYYNTGEVGAALNEFFSIVDRNFESFDMAQIVGNGQLLILSENPIGNQVFNESKALGKSAFLKRVNASICFYDLSHRTLYEHKPTQCSGEIKSILKNILG